MEALLLPSAVILKGLLYTLWTRFGMRRFGFPEDRRPWLRSALLAGIRLGGGLLLGIGWGALLMGTGGESYGRLGFHPGVWYAGVLMIRWLLWSAVAALLWRELRRWAMPKDRRDLAWRLGAWGLSLAGDAGLLSLGLGLGGIPC
jgi:hypothetical protein